MSFSHKKKEKHAQDDPGSDRDKAEEGRGNSEESDSSRNIQNQSTGNHIADGEPSADKAEEDKSFWGCLAEALIILIAAIVFAVILQAFFVKTFVITSTSMSPTLQEGDRVMVDRLTYRFRDPRRGDIILFRYPPDTPEAKNTENILYWPFEQMGEIFRATHRNTTPYVKRVVAVGGETIELKKGKLYIDGEKIEEDYINDNSSNYGPFEVPEGTVFCLGDNRLNSRDSRAWGPVPLRSVIGRLFFVWWPPSRFGRP